MRIFGADALPPKKPPGRCWRASGTRYCDYERLRFFPNYQPGDQYNGLDSLLPATDGSATARAWRTVTITITQCQRCARASNDTYNMVPRLRSIVPPPGVLAPNESGRRGRIAESATGGEPEQEQ